MTKEEGEKTVGQQLLDRIEKNNGEKFAEVREVSEEWFKNNFLKEMERIIDDPVNQDFEEFYITVIAKKEANIEQMLHVKYITTLTLVDPCYAQMVFKYTKAKDSLELIRNIATPDVAMQMKDNPFGGWDRQMLKDTLEYSDSVGLKVKIIE